MSDDAQAAVEAIAQRVFSTYGQEDTQRSHGIAWMAVEALLDAGLLPAPASLGGDADGGTAEERISYQEWQRRELIGALTFLAHHNDGDHGTTLRAFAKNALKRIVYQHHERPAPAGEID